MKYFLFSSNVCRLVDDTSRFFHNFNVTSLKLWRQIKGYCYTKPYFRIDMYIFRTKSTQINILNIYLLKNVKNWKCENLPIRALFLRCTSFDIYLFFLIFSHLDKYMYKKSIELTHQMPKLWNRVYSSYWENTVGCQQNFSWWQPVIRLFRLKMLLTADPALNKLIEIYEIEMQYILRNKLSSAFFFQ